MKKRELLAVLLLCLSVLFACGSKSTTTGEDTQISKNPKKFAEKELFRHINICDKHGYYLKKVDLVVVAIWEISNMDEVNFVYEERNISEADKLNGLEYYAHAHLEFSCPVRKIFRHLNDFKYYDWENWSEWSTDDYPGVQIEIEKNNGVWKTKSWSISDDNLSTCGEVQATLKYIEQVLAERAKKYSK